MGESDKAALIQTAAKILQSLELAGLGAFHSAIAARALGDAGMAGMHHCDCDVHPGWCGQAGCLPCEQTGRVATKQDSQ